MHDLGTKVLEIKRLILRKITKDDDIQVFNNWSNDSQTNKYVTWELHCKLENAKKIFELWETLYN